MSSIRNLAREKNRQKLMKLLEEYKNYKTSYAMNIKFDPKVSDLGK